MALKQKKKKFFFFFFKYLRDKLLIIKIKEKEVKENNTI
jgi:hypothetical protein